MGAQPTQSQARSPAGHAGSFPALPPAGSGGFPQRPIPRSVAGQTPPPLLTAICPNEVWWKNPKRFGETHFPALPAQRGMPGDPPCPAAAAPATHAVLLSFLSGGKTLPHQAQHHTPRFALAPRPNTGTESPSPESPAPRSQKARCPGQTKTPQSKETPTFPRQAGLAPRPCLPACLLQLETEPLPLVQHLEAQQKLP